ncbi:hemolysin family protein [Saccharibacillus alkalitolerans]|uniref:HlyC/CorC family transporter n=1 Tax=Saccharibacillus alkalitolerans TaxID=2705290 RepID=A0ABX0F9F8_9BACL|nr:hemolysin family protein [Saccharibacillus alkalitolerans]NGZ77035.1 HlyC/CorC family transporter [Saccharibacillus alkalitolerans]
MDGTIALNLFLVAVFIGLTAFFVGAEFAILKVRMSRLDQLIADGNKKAVMAKKVAQDLDYYLSACQLGITITALVLGALGEPTVEKMLHPVFERFDVPDTIATVLSYGIALALVTFLHVVIGELAPKTLAIQFAEKMTLLLAPSLYRFGRMTAPFIRLLNGSASALLRLFGVKPAGHESVHSEEELKWLVEQSYESGEINKTEQAYLQNIFAFDNRQLREIMIPADKIVKIAKEVPQDELVAKLSEHEYTRYPVTNGDPDSFIGFVHSKEVLTAIAAGRDGRIEGFIHKLPRFTETATLREVMLAMQQRRVHMASVSDASGRTIGLVTMEDILEEIVGDIRDEADGVRLPLAPL